MSSTLDASSIVDLVGLGSGLRKQLQQTGHLPKVSLHIKPLKAGGALGALASAVGISTNIELDHFLGYQFSSNILTPVDSFSFTFAAPDDSKPFNASVKEGDIVTLFANDEPLATGLIDSTEVETDESGGEKVTVVGRDLMGQLEDHSAISIQNKPIYVKNASISDMVKALISQTKIQGYETQDEPSGSFLFSTEPMESKLSALQRYLEPLNCLAWMTPEGKLKVGKPDMSGQSKGILRLSKEQKDSNVLSMRVVRSSTQIPTLVLPIWAGMEFVQDKVAADALYNKAEGPSRLHKAGQILPRTIVVSNPDGKDSQGLPALNALLAAGGNHLFEAYAKRELARANQKELIVTAVMAGHYNEKGEPFSVDTLYKIEYDRGDVNEEMYLFGVEYQLSEDSGQKTILSFCRVGTIVADVKCKLMLGAAFDLGSIA